MKRKSLKNKSKSNILNKNISIVKNVNTKSIINNTKFRKRKYTLPKKRNKDRKYNNCIIFDKNKNKSITSNASIKIIKNLKPKTKKNKDLYVANKSTQWTLRKTKFDHYISSNELMLASVKEKTANTYISYGNAFYNYIEQIKIVQKDLPSLKDILNNFNIFQLDVLIYEFLTSKFNERAVRGGTLHNTACGILYSLAIKFGITLTCELLPGTRRLCKGAENKYIEIFGIHPRGKYPILNPILEKMLEYANEDEKFALLVAQRFCLRSQHYCNNRSQNVRNKNYYLKRRDFVFIPNQKNPRAICITTRFDKNNPNLEHMDRVVYCCCKATKWTCIVHVAKERFDKYYFDPDTALLQCKSGDMYYRAMLAIVKSLIKKSGLDPKNYGTHSCRSGGTTELFMIGKQAIWIQNFGWWNNIGSVMIYIKPNNPDLLNFVSSSLEYQELRAREGGDLDKREKHLTDLQLEIVKQSNKSKRGNKIGKVVKKAAVIASANNATIVPANLAQRRVKKQQHFYTQYHKHTYLWSNERGWYHNPSARPHLAMSPVGDVRTIRANVNASFNMHTASVGIPPSNYNYFHHDWNSYTNVNNYSGNLNTNKRDMKNPYKYD